MLDKFESSHSKVQHLECAAPTNQRSTPTSSSFIFTGIQAFKPRKNTVNDGPTQCFSRRSSCTISMRRVSVVSCNEDGVVVVRDQSRNQDDNDDQCPVQVDSDDDRDDDVTAVVSSSEKRIRPSWRHLQLRFAPKSKTEAKPATVMYSISFYPWKMEAHGYYSHPEAAANWVPDTASARCQICTAAFSLIRRRHHCRLCGHLVCADCSHDRTYLPFAGGSRSQHRLIKDGAPQRTCSACAGTLRNMAAQDDPRVKRFTVAVGSARKRKSAASASVLPSLVEVEVERPSPWLRRTGIALTDSDIEDEEFYLESTKALERDSTSGETTHHFPLRLSVTRAEELDEILSARARSRLFSSHQKTNQYEHSQPSGSRQFVISSAWLDQWLQYVRVDSVSGHTSSSNVSSSQLLNEAQDSKSHSHRATAKCRMSRPPRPGPVANYELLDFVNGELVARSGLQRSRGSQSSGDYRVVSQEVWVTFLELYGGGPSIQMPLNNDAECSGRELVSADTTSKLGNFTTSCQWIISELDDSLPAIAGSPTMDIYSSATRAGATRVCGNQTNCTTAYQSIENDSNASSHTTSGRRLISVSSMSSLIKKTSEHSTRRRSVYELVLAGAARPAASTELLRPSSHSRWKLWEDEPPETRAEVTRCSDRTSGDMMTSTVSSTGIQSSRRRTVGDASPSLAAVSAFANAATLARQRSAMSLSRHPAAISSRVHGSVHESH